MLFRHQPLRFFHVIWRTCSARLERQTAAIQTKTRDEINLRAAAYYSVCIYKIPMLSLIASGQCPIK
jgi:hypothetical protein